jgi:hypothetical protein
MKDISKQYLSVLKLACCLILVSGCSVNPPMTLMPTPVMYEATDFEPFSHIVDELQTPLTHVFYATNRKHQQNSMDSPYGNEFDNSLYLGKATVRIGERETQ